MIQKSYNIHNVVTFKVIDTTGCINKHFNDIYTQYKNFESELKDEPDFIVYMGSFRPSAPYVYSVLDDTYYVGEEYIYCMKDSYKLARWKLELSGLEGGPLRARVSHNTIGGTFIPSTVLDFLISFVLNAKGLSLVHAACVSRDDRGYLFSARGGGGKTSIALYLLKRGFSLLGDNFAILTSNKILSCLFPFSIFTYNLSPTIKRSMQFKQKVMLNLSSILNRLTYGYAKIFIKVNPDRLTWISKIDKSEIHSAVVLVPGHKLLIEEISKEDLINHLIWNQKLEFSYFDKYISAYSFVFPKSTFAQYWYKYRRNLEKNINDSVCSYRIEFPWQCNRETFSRIIESLQRQ